MRLKRLFTRNSLLVVAGLGCLWLGVFAYATVDRTVPVFEELLIIPGQVTSDSWLSGELALLNDLPEFALYQSYTRENSAYLDVSILATPMQAGFSESPVRADESGEASASIDSSDLSESAVTDEVEIPTASLESRVDENQPEVVTPESAGETAVPDAGEVSFRLGLPLLSRLFPLAQAESEMAVSTTAVSQVEPELVENNSEVVTTDTAQNVDNDFESATSGSAVDNLSAEQTSDTASSTAEDGSATDEATEQSGLDSPAAGTGDDYVSETAEIVDSEDVIEAGLVEDDSGEAYINQYRVECEQIARCQSYDLEFAGFFVPNFEPGTFLSSVQVRVAMAARTRGAVDSIQRMLVEYTYGGDEDWRVATMVEIDNEISNGINGGPFLVSIAQPSSQADISNLRVRVVYQGDLEQLERAYVTGLWLDVVATSFYEDPTEAVTDTISYSRDLQSPKFHSLHRDELDLSSSRLPSFTMSYNPQQNILRRAITALISDNEYAVDFIKITDRTGQVVEVPIKVDYHNDRTWTLALQAQPQRFVPGKYTLTLGVKENNQLYTDSFEFYWGVLAVNTTKSMYEVGETVTFNLAALTDKGDTICDARLELKVIDPSNRIHDLLVEQSGACGKNNVTDIPDYLASFSETSELGRYVIQLKHRNRAGEVVHKIEDSFEVRDYVPFVIERTGPTRIYPPAPYYVTLDITANRSFRGDIIERTPRGFVFPDDGGAEIVTRPEFIELIWRDIVMEEGDRLTLRYQFDAPDISPYLYLLGPLDMDGFRELRHWQIASDALAAVAWLTGTETLLGTNLNSSPSQLIWSSSTIDGLYFNHSTTTNPQRLYIKQAGDYKIAISLPIARTAGGNRRTRVGAEVRVNGTVVPTGLARSGFMQYANNQDESSNNLVVLLTDLQIDDYIEIFVEGVTTININDIVNVTGQAALYMEYVPPAVGVFAATTTQTTNSTNLNQSTAYPLEWIETRQDSGFVHSNSVNPENIILSNPGAYLVYINIPLSNGATTNTSPKGIVRLDGVQVPGGNFMQGFARGTGTQGDGSSSMHWSGVVISTTTNQILTVTTQQEANAGTVTVPSGFVGSIFIQQLPSDDVIFVRGTNTVTAGTNWNDATKRSIRWQTQLLRDTTIFSHSTTTNDHQITVNEAGDYVLVYNDALTSPGTNHNARITVEVDGTEVSGARTQSNYISNSNGHNESSASLVYQLSGLTAGQIITVSTQREGHTTSNITAQTDALLLLWRKAELNLQPEEPTTYEPFDSIRFASTTPSFEFTASDPDGSSDIQYEFSISTSSSFSASTTRRSGVDAGFSNLDTPADTSPFIEGERIRFTLQSADELENNTTYYWRVRARDVSGSNIWSDWSTTRSLTVDLNQQVPSWYQFATGQFETNTLIGAVADENDRVLVESILQTEAMLVYSEGTVQTPRYRFWDGIGWGVELSAESVGGTINWSQVAAGTTRDEYVLANITANNRLVAQVYNASSSSWGNVHVQTTAFSVPAYRGVAVAYETNSGRALVISCDGTNMQYSIWDGNSWSGPTTTSLVKAQNCQFVRATSNPASDEIIAVFTHVNTGALDYEALVWDGTEWSNSVRLGESGSNAVDGSAVAYNREGTQAVITTSNNTTPASFSYSVWDGSSWTTPVSELTSSRPYWITLQSNPTDSSQIGMCYANSGGTVVYAGFWTGTFWTGGTVLSTSVSDTTTQAVDCQYETTAGRNGNFLVTYANTTATYYRFYDGSIWSSETAAGAIPRTPWVNLVRIGDGTILGAFYKRATARDVRVSEFNGSSWSTETVIETNPTQVTSATPREPFALAPKRFQFNEGTVTTQPIAFTNVPNQPTWGDITFTSNEPLGTDVKVQVLYTNVTTCDTLVPDGALSGNSSGFDVNDVPIDISGLSTTTYSQLCLRATISTQGQSSAALDSWELSWQRKPKLNQSSYRWYTNGSFFTPTDPWPPGSSDIAENTAISSLEAISANQVTRLRLSLEGLNVPLPAFSEDFKLQYASGLTCTADMSWQDVAPVGSTTAIWRGYVNSIVGDDWLGAGWGRRIKLTVDNAQVAEGLTNFPVYVDLGTLPAGFFSSVKSDGGDIRVTRDDGVSEVPFELVTINTSLQTGELHFKADLASTTDSVYFIYYGNPSATAYAANATYGSYNVWTNNFVAVYHLEETGGIATDAYKDSTANQYHAQGGGGTASQVPVATTSGMLGRAQDFDGSNDFITNNRNATALGMAGSSTRSISGWGYTRAFNGGGLWRLGSTGTNGQDFSLRAFTTTNVWRVQYWGPLDHDVTFTPSGNRWVHFSQNYTGATSTVYFDGLTRTNSNVARALNTTNGTNFSIGIWQTTYLNGMMDEVRLASVARSAGWVLTEFNNQNSPISFYSLSPEEFISDGRQLPSTVLSDSDLAETYVEENPTRVNQSTIGVGERAEWDFVLQNNGAAANTTYCFRLVYENGTLLNNYIRYPRLVTNAPPLAPVLFKPFDNERLAPLTPAFEFAATDVLNDLIAYQIQVSTDPEFGSTVIDRNSVDHFTLFENIAEPSQRGEYTSGQRIRFVPNTSLTNGTTYYWRVRGIDPFGSNTYGAWSTPDSFTVDTTNVITTWFQTTAAQFGKNDLDNTVTNTGGQDVRIAAALSNGTTTSMEIDFNDRTTGNAWGQFSFTNNVSSGNIRYHVEYRNTSGQYVLIPNTDLPGNSAGFTSSPVDLINLDTVTYRFIRLVAVLSGNDSLPRLQDWTVEWGERIEVPTLLQPFDNAKVATTSPVFTFFTTDPEADDIQYEIQIDSTSAFTSPSTFTSGVDSGFLNTITPADTSPFNNEEVIRYTPTGTYTNGNTYWWRVRARDPFGANSWSAYSAPHSFTVDTSIETSVWFQTTGEQFATNQNVDIETTAGGAQVTSVISGVLAAYGQGTEVAPRYRVWNGNEWSEGESMAIVGAPTRWLALAAAPTRPEYALGVQTTANTISVQIYNQEADSWGNLETLQTTVDNNSRRAFDITYESVSGRLMAVVCDGDNAHYSTWNGSSWSATTTITLAKAQPCQWIRLTSNPTSNEIIAAFRQGTTGSPDHEVWVWDGNSWGNNFVLGDQGTSAAYEGMAIGYNASGTQALAVVANGTASNFNYRVWNGSSWSSATTHTIGKRFNWGSLVADPYSNRIALCFVTHNNTGANVGVAFWDGSAWDTTTTLTTAANDQGGQAVDCQFEITTGREGYLMVSYSDTTEARFQVATSTNNFTDQLSINSMARAWQVIADRAGDGTIHTLWFNHQTTPRRYAHSRWDGSVWSDEEFFSTNTSVTATPFHGSIALRAQVYPAVTSALMRSTPIRFSDGLGPRWERVTWSDTTQGDSEIRYRLYYETTPDVYVIIPDSALAGNAAGFTSSPLSIASLDRTIYANLILEAELTCVDGDCPSIEDWSVEWSEGISVSGTAYEYNASTTLSGGTVAVAVNGVLQSGKTATIQGDGTFTISNVTAFEGNTITVYIDGAADADEAVGVTKYDGVGDVTGMMLIQRHLTVGSDDVFTINNAELGSYDNNDNEDIFFSLGVGNLLTLCVESACSDARLRILPNTTYQPGANATVINFDNYGTFNPATNTLRVAGEWRQLGTFNTGDSTVIFTATSSSYTLQNATTTLTFHNVTFGETSGSATWSITKSLLVNGSLTVNHGTLDRGTSSINLARNLQLGLDGYFSGLGTTTFDGSGSHTWGDAKATSTTSNVGRVVVDGTTKTITLSGHVRAESVTIGADDTLNSSGSGYTMSVVGNWTNNNLFVPQNSTVDFVGTSTGVIARGTSAFNNLTFSGVGGAWSFSTSTLALNGNFTIATGTVTLPNGTTTIAGSFVNTGTFLHNNGEVRLTSTAGGRTIRQSGTATLNAFYDLVFAGSGSWSYLDTNATTSRNYRITAGSVTFPSGQLTVGGNFSVTGGGSFSHNNGELVLVVERPDELRTNGSSLNNVRIIGTQSNGWYNNNWSTRRAITVNSGMVSGVITDFPVYVNLAHLGSGLFTTARSDGADIRVTTADGNTEVPFELVSFSVASSTGELHFKAPSLSTTTDTLFYVYYGNPDATAYNRDDTYGSENVWTNGYQAVYHFEEIGNTSTTSYLDSTANRFHAQGGGGSAAQVPVRIAGQLGFAQSYDGSNDYIETTRSASVLGLTGTGPKHISAWAYTSLYGSRGVWGVGNAGTTLQEFSFRTNTGTDNWRVQLWGSDLDFTFPSENQWVHFAMDFASTNLIAYANGGVANSGTRAVNVVNGQTLTTGRWNGGNYFSGRIDELRVANVSRSAGWVLTEYRNQASTTDFYGVGSAEPRFTRNFTDTNATILGNLNIDGGVATFPTGILSVGGSFANNSFFVANGGTVRFNSTAGAETINPGNSSFATLDFNSATGDFTVVSNATATTAVLLTNADQFTVASSTNLATLGTFTNAINPTNTTWTGSTLVFGGNNDITTSAKTYAGDIYGTIRTLGTTTARFWNSSASIYDTVASSSIYSQDHGGNDGDLYIFGNYTRTSGTENWSYTTDFDGADLTGGDERVVNVRLASSSVARFTGSSSLQILGVSGLPTSIDAQSGRYSLQVDGATIEAEYASFTNGDADGLQLLGATNIPLFTNLSFVVTDPNASAITVASTTIDTNAASQFFFVDFATTSAISAFNVSTIGLTTSFLIFKQGGGNLYGEEFDNDDGNPGMIQWDDSSFSFTISGRVFDADGVNALTSGICDGASPVVTIVIDGAVATSTPCQAGTGNYEARGLSFTGDPTIMAFLDESALLNPTEVVLRGSATGTRAMLANAANSNPRFDITRPAVETGDFLLAIIGKDDHNFGITAPAGWTAATSLGSNAGGDSIHSSVWYRFVSDKDKEPSSYTFTSNDSSAENAVFWVGAFSGVDPVDPFDVTPTLSRVQNSGSPSAPSVTTTVAGSYVIANWFARTTTGATMPGAPWTSIAPNTINSSGDPLNLSVSGRLMSTTGATGGVSVTGWAAGIDSNVGQIVLRRQVGSTTIPLAATVTRTPVINSSQYNPDPITIVESFSQAGTVAGSSNILVSRPMVETGDVLLLVLGRDDDPVVNAPAGWTPISTLGSTGSGDDIFSGAWYRVITDASNEPASYNFASTDTTTEGFAYWIASVRGLDNINPIETAGSWQLRVNNSSPVADSVTTSNDNSLVLAAWVPRSGSTITLPSSPWSNVVNTAVNEVRVGVSSRKLTTAGASGDTNITGLASTNESHAIQFALRPAGYGIPDRIGGFDLRAQHVITRSESGSPMTIADMDGYDNSDNASVPYAVTISPNTLTISPNTGLLVSQSSSFIPSGNVTLLGNGNVNPYEGAITLATSSSFVSVGTQTHSLSGSLQVGNSATLTTASSSFVFTATTTGKAITAPSALTFHNLSFTGAGGSWNINPVLTVGGDMNIASGTVTGTSNITVTNGSVSGNGTLSLGGGTLTIQRANTWGGVNPWTVNNLTLGNGTTVGTTTFAGTATTTVLGTLTVSNAHFLSPGSGVIDLAGSGTVFVRNGTFTEGNSTVVYSGGNANVLNTTYYNLTLAALTSPATYTALGSGALIRNDLLVAGATSTTFTLATNNATYEVRGNVTINSGRTLIASSLNPLSVHGDWTNAGTFTSSNGTVRFIGSGTSNINAGASSFGNVEVNASGTVGLASSATSTGAWNLINHSLFDVNGNTLAVGGVFSNGLGGAFTDWSGSILSLFGTGTYSINASTSADIYDELRVASGTQIRMWNSSANSYNVATNGSIYSQDHANQNGELYIFGNLIRTTGSDHWSYATDFDGTNLTGGSERIAQVFLANGATAIWQGGSLSALGGGGATTTIQNQGSGTYDLTFGSGATVNFNRVQIRDIGVDGVVFAGTPTVTDFSRTDHLVAVDDAVAITVGGTAINANEAKNFTGNIFNVGVGLTNVFNVRATGTAISSWRFTNELGNFAGEDFDDDPAGDPGYIVWSDSAQEITIAGIVYSDEGVTVSSICDGVTNNIRLIVDGLTSYSTSCAPGTGAYSIPNVSYNTLDPIIVYIDGETPKAANVTFEPVSSISNMHLYHDRVIVRHEGTNPITIAQLARWDSSDDSDVPFTANLGSPDTLVLPANRKLIVWTGKTFEPNGNVTVSGGGSGDARDGTLEVQVNGRFRAKGSENHTIGGSFIFGTGAEFVSASSTITLTSTASGRTINTNNNPYHHLTITGSGAFTMTDSTLTLNGSYNQSAGAVTLPIGTTTAHATFSVTGSGSITAPDTPFVFTAPSGTQTVRFNGGSVGALTFAGAGTFNLTDVNATSTGSVTITAGTVTLPSGSLSTAGSFEKRAGILNANGGEIIMRATSSALLMASSSDLASVRFIGDGPFTITDTNITFLGSFRVASGTVLMASGTTAVGGSFEATGGTFTHATGTVLLNAGGAGRVLSPGNSTFHNLQFSAPAGGYSVFGATTTNNLTIASVNNLVVEPGAVVTVGGVFSNTVGGAATTWTNSTLVLNGTAPYSINGRTNNGDVYGTLMLGNSVNIRMWYSSAATTTVASNSSLYSQDHGNNNGLLHIYGDMKLGTSTEYWNYATDFDGTALTSGNERAVTVRLAENATTTLLSGSLQILGGAGNPTRIERQTTGSYAFRVEGGTFNANQYEIRHMNISGLTLTGTPTITELSNGFFELLVDTGTIIHLSSTTLNANPSKIFDNVGFTATTSVSGFNVQLVGETTNAWRFTNHYGGLSGEAFDIDGIDNCGSIRWDNSSCLLTEQTRIRWRLDNGGEGAPDSEWYDLDWDYRKRVRIQNNDSQAYATTAVKVIVAYDSAMQSNFADLRFTLENGVTITPHWIERVVASTEAVVWVEVPSLPPSGQSVVNMYFGNGSASSTSSSTSVFAVIDDFEDANITEYSGGTGDVARFTTVSSPVYGGSRALAAANPTGKTTDGIFRFDQPVSQGQIIRYMQYVDTVSGSGDEPCTLFGVQSPGTLSQNYAVCLEQFGPDRISLARNVENNDVSGTVLATTSVTYATGWYEVEIDWRTNNSINVYLYNPSGTLVATTSATDSTYTSGGYGFAFWYHYGAWDSFTARPRTTSRPSVYVGARQSAGGAAWLGSVDGVGAALPGNTLRLRVAIENSGLDITNQLFRLEYAAKGVAPTCESVSNGSFTSVPNQAACGSSPVCMQTSSFVSDGGATTDLLTNTKGEFTAGRIITSPSNQTGSYDLSQSRYTELEYTLTPTINASDAYCFRVTNAGTPLDFYAKIAELGLQFDPFFGIASLNDGLDITLTPGVTTSVAVSALVTDFNGFADLAHATATIYRSGVGPSCTPNSNNCFVLSTTANTCEFSSCSGNSCTLTCTAAIPFHADPTDDGAYDGEEWLAFMEVDDSGGGYDFVSATGVELLTLRALNVDDAINYGSLEPNQDTGAFNPMTTVVNLGNVAIDVDVEATDLAAPSASSIIPAEQQKVATSTFTYSACVICQNLSSSTPITLGLELAKPTTITPPVETDVYWGIAVPFGISPQPHTGVNIFTPVGI